jgi:ABC-type hemin transport system ATPase subunit
VLVALHDLNLVARIADQVVLLVNGKLKAAGSVGTVLQPELLSEAYGIPLTRLKPGRSKQAFILPS